MKIVKKLTAIVLCATMIMCGTLPNVANAGDGTQVETTESVDSSKESVEETFSVAEETETDEEKKNEKDDDREPEEDTVVNDEEKGEIDDSKNNEEFDDNTEEIVIEEIEAVEPTEAETETGSHHALLRAY